MSLWEKHEPHRMKAEKMPEKLEVDSASAAQDAVGSEYEKGRTTDRLH